MKREVMFVFIFIFLLISISLIYASEEAQVEKAYTCLESRTNTTAKCSALSFEEKVFSLLATGNCQNETSKANITSNQCWTDLTNSNSCKIKSTAQAVLALNEKVNTTKAENWLLTQTAIPDMDWFLEIESLSAMSCTIIYSNSPYTILIGENKKIYSQNLGAGLNLAQDNYWLGISPSIYNNDITVSCDKPFITTLLFKKKGSSTVHVSETVHSSAAKGRTTEKVNSLCFSQAGVCNYEGSLWATFVLYTIGYDVSNFMPYLITMIDNESNQVYFSESFLYFLTGKFRTELLLKNNGLYWEESGDKYYDTALALWPFYYESPFEKENSKSWLLNVQQNTGCWNNGNLRDTAFILYSIWPKFNPSGKCSFDNDCSQVSCKQSFCNEGVCLYDSISCEDDNNCCKICSSNSDCNIYASETDKYCSADNTKVYKNVSTWTCENSKCAEQEKFSLFETCDGTEECYLGNCLVKGDIPNECDSSLDCYEEDCVDGECVPYESLDCQNAGYFCMPDINCEGNPLYDYSCIGVFTCCDAEISLKTCSDEGGKICADNEICIDGTTVDVSDITYGESCCVGGTCEKEAVTSTCVNNKGICKSSCGSNEEKNSNYYCGSGESCCIAKKKQSYLWIWILSFLILISALGIIFRDKLRNQWMKLKEKFGGKKDKKKFEMPLVSHPNPQGRILPRRIFPPQSRYPMRGPISSQHNLINKKPEEKTKNDLDDVLKKLKEMGK